MSALHFSRLRLNGGADDGSREVTNAADVDELDPYDGSIGGVVVHFARVGPTRQSPLVHRYRAYRRGHWRDTAGLESAVLLGRSGRDQRSFPRCPQRLVLLRPRSPCWAGGVVCLAERARAAADAAGQPHACRSARSPASATAHGGRLLLRRPVPGSGGSSERRPGACAVDKDSSMDSPGARSRTRHPAGAASPHLCGSWLAVHCRNLGRSWPS